MLTYLPVNDNDDLAQRAKVLLNRMCGVMPPRPLLYPVLNSLLAAIETSPVYNIRQDLLE